MSELRWTKDVPTETGWYWWRSFSHREQIVEVSEWPSKCSLFVPRGYGHTERPDLMGGEWAGPIEEPKE